MVRDIEIIQAMYESEQKAWKSLAGYKFLMFGYHAAAWVKYKNLLKKSNTASGAVLNPFSELVKLARTKII